ncbi:T-cell surface antigen CD2-like [Thunnus albacares]|uniref:T-cell surface antigen CD2-like n=1 Tax=Thunnus albacares TaxID=8236 RepID=UPI001CF69967|nr:T-cell surface antigen CD2-like [Thunnus albacares]
MEKPTSCFLSVLLLLAVPSSVSAEDKFFGEGGELLLRPPVSEDITSIQWKHNNNLVAEWVKGIVGLQYYGGFNNRTTLNIITGDLEIRNMSLADSGEYSVEINNKVQPKRYTAKLIGRVPKPAVLVKPLTCTATSENCILTCHGNTEEAEPVTYSWKMGGEEWEDGKKDRKITNDETTKRVKTFSCRMNNTISEEESKPKDNPFYKDKPTPSPVIPVVVVLVLIALFGVCGCVGFRKRKDIEKRINELRKSGTSSNGNENNPESNPLQNQGAEENEKPGAGPGP